MTATIIRLEVDKAALWTAYNEIRAAFLAHPTPAGMDARMAAFRPFFIKLVGKGWQDTIGEAMERERMACVTLLNAARGRQGGQHAPPAG
jgi:hypothetical protein